MLDAKQEPHKSAAGRAHPIRDSKGDRRGARTRFGRLAVVVGAALSIFVMHAVALEQRSWLGCAILVSGVTFGSYAIDAVVDERALARISRRSYALGIFAALGWSGTSVVWAAWHSVPGRVCLFALLFPFSVVLYATPWIRCFGSRKPRRVKDIPFVKAFYVAGMWAMLAVLAGFADGSRLRAVVALGAITFLKIWVNTVLCDMHDIAADRVEGIPTIPVRLGFDCSLVILHGVNLLAATAVVVATWVGVLPLFLVVLVAHDVLVLYLLVRTQRSRVAPPKDLVDGLLLLLGPLASLAGSIARR